MLRVLYSERGSVFVFQNNHYFFLTSSSRIHISARIRFDIFKYLSEILHGSKFCWDWKGSKRYKSKYTFMVLLHAQQEPSNKEKVAQEVRDVVGINHEANIDEFVADITDAALEQMHHLHAITLL
ncbi:hypothetical protein ABKV19_006344 [Rosa sericea]